MNNPNNAFSRRDFLQLSALAAAGLATGCATNPVSGRSQLMLVSEGQEIQIDKKNSPHQFSSDYGPSQDTQLNTYIQQTGTNIATQTHRLQMPYSFKCVNAVYINAYAFPGGSIALTRGVLLAMQSEAELAALLGHELGHVNARHTAQQMSKGTLAQVLAGGLAIYANSASRVYGQIASQLGSLGAGALLASYSRAHEREADELALQYMTKSSYNPNGMIDLMEMLNRKSKRTPNVIELMFATHPMSSERLANAKRTINNQYGQFLNKPMYRERYMDKTARLRKIKGAIEEMQKAEKEMAKKKYQSAESHLKKALKQAPNDYAALCMMSKVLAMQNKNDQALIYSKKAQDIYPQEAQAHHLHGFTCLRKNKFKAALQDFSTYDRLLPGNPNTLFYLGVSLDGMGHREQAASHYYNYIRSVNQGQQAQYAHQRLVGWGYLKK